MKIEKEDATVIEEKIARICWNTEEWRKPSGESSKSKYKQAYEHKYGYGHEEWLLDTTKLINGYHYTHLQPIGRCRVKYIGKTFNISLYSINAEDRTRWWVGRISDVIVTTAEESREAYATYERNGWLKEMKDQLQSVGGDVQEFRKTKHEDFFVVRFRPSSLELLDTPKEFPRNDPAVGTARYVLLSKEKTPKLIETRFVFSPGHKKKKISTDSSDKGHSGSIDLVHNQMQNEIYWQLVRKFGKNNVRTEQPVGYGPKVDIVVKDNDGNYIFYEIKAEHPVRLCIRESLGQLLDYAYYPNVNNAKKLVLVSPNPITPEAETYLRTIRNKFHVALYYERYDEEKKSLEETPC
jgi:hypothetical protein